MAFVASTDDSFWEMVSAESDEERLNVDTMKERTSMKSTMPAMDCFPLSSVRIGIARKSLALRICMEGV